MPSKHREFQSRTTIGEHILDQSPTPAEINDLYDAAKAIALQQGAITVALLQRHLRSGYNRTLTIVQTLEQNGVINPINASGLRTLTQRYTSSNKLLTDLKQMQTMNLNLVSMLDKFDGCEGGDAGTPTNPSIWLFGVEPGWSKFDQENTDASKTPIDDGYSIEAQLQWPYNRNAFKLLAAIAGFPLSQYREFASEHQPFVQGSKGYFKGNLYPYACNNVDHWPEDAAAETGLASKTEYQQWCNEYRWPAIKSWIDEHQPNLFIGVGNTFRDQFSLSVFGRSIELECHEININGYSKKLYFGQSDGRKLVVIPHLSGGSNGLNSDEAIEKAGTMIGSFLKG